MLSDELDGDPVRRELVESTVTGLAVDTPEPGAADIGKARAELVAEQMKDVEDRVDLTCRVGHDLGRREFGFLLEHDGEQVEAVA